MDLRVWATYHVPLDLKEQYDDKIADVNRWLEEQLVERGVIPSVTRHIRMEDNEKGVKVRTEKVHLHKHPTTVRHGIACPKVVHKAGISYEHGPTDDRPYDVDGVTYCGRCHSFLQ